jgi:hypothetical protein
MGWQEDRRQQIDDVRMEIAAEQQWWDQNFPEPTNLIRQQDQEYRNELAKLSRERELRRTAAR